MFLIEDHHRESINSLMVDLFDCGDTTHGNVLYDMLPEFIPHRTSDPVDMSEAQLATVWKKWRISDQGISFVEFLSKVQPTLGMDDAIAIEWCGMWLCIETNGESHS